MKNDGCLLRLASVLLMVWLLVGVWDLPLCMLLL